MAHDSVRVLFAKEFESDGQNLTMGSFRVLVLAARVEIGAEVIHRRNRVGMLGPERVQERSPRAAVEGFGAIEVPLSLHCRGKAVSAYRRVGMLVAVRLLVDVERFTQLDFGLGVFSQIVQS